MNYLKDRGNASRHAVARAVGFLLGVLLVFPVLDSQAQSLRISAPERIVAGQEAALYLDWRGSGPFEGGVLSLPAGWTLEEVQLLDGLGNRSGLRVRPTAADSESAFSVVPVSPLPGTRTVVVRALAGGSGAVPAPWTFTPYVSESVRPGSIKLKLDEVSAVRVAVPVVDPDRSENRALQLSAGDGSSSVIVDASRLPDLSGASAFTVEAWMRTSRTDQVVLSTWDGKEETPYALEAVIDREGFLVSYQGMPGDHRAMRSRARIADGSWHHVAVAYDPERAWSRLVVDGVASDSLNHSVPLAVRTPQALGLGGRVLGVRSPATYAGDLDELRVWAVARTPAMIRSAVFRQLPEPAAGARFFSFDRPPERSDLLPFSGRLRVVDSDLSFRGVLTDVTVEMSEPGVSLGWRLVPSSRDRFEIERSSDGRRWDGVGFLTAADGIPVTNGESQFRFLDPEIHSTVAYYRIRLLRGQSESVSNAVKVGRTESVVPRLAVLEGNFPNPFNPTTTIRFSLEETQEVSISVWDLSGQLVTTLFSGTREAGQHAVNFSAVGLPSGTYFVRMESAEGLQSHPMLLMK